MALSAAAERILAKHERHQRRVWARMVRTAARLLWQDDMRRCGRAQAGTYDYERDPSLQDIVTRLLADRTVRHIDIPRRAFRAYCED